MTNRHFEDPFIKILPKIDIHGETSDTVSLLVKEFIRDEQFLGHLKVAIIHGWHSKILKNAVHTYLKTDKRVERYYIYNYNNGITIIELKNNVK